LGKEWKIATLPVPIAGVEVTTVTHLLLCRRVEEDYTTNAGVGGWEGGGDWYCSWWEAQALVLCYSEVIRLETWRWKRLSDDKSDCGSIWEVGGEYELLLDAFY
jgi:hypothetical protein